MASALTEHGENAYQTSNVLASRYEHFVPEPVTLNRIQQRLLEAVRKLKQVSQKLSRKAGLIRSSRSRGSITLSALIACASSYQSQVLVGASGARALSHDWFYVFQQERPYMQRDFLFGTPSQKRFCA